jgi:predicted deacylase
MVGKGDLLAEIYDDDGCRTAMLAAPRAGIVMMLRRHSRVAEGTSVAIVAAAPQECGPTPGRDPIQGVGAI